MSFSNPQTKDAIGRRKRDKRTSTSKRVTLQERDLLWLQKIQRHGPLSSSYLHAFSKSLRCNSKRARDRLTDLYNENHTPHNGPYLERPWQQFQTYDARYQELIYDLAPAGIAALKGRGFWHENSQVQSGPWIHKYMVSCITASAELATIEHPDLTYIPQEKILSDAKTTLRCLVSFKNPTNGKTIIKDLIPDALFGLEYKIGSTMKYRYFIVEADRATEPTRSSKFNRKSHLRSFLQYREYVGQGLYKDHLKLNGGIMVLTITTNERTMLSMIKLVEELSQKGNQYLLFQVCDHFDRYFKPAKPITSIITDGWLRAGFNNFDISQA